MSQTYTYTPENQVASITDRTGTTVTATFTYTYDADGRETQEVEMYSAPVQTVTTVYTYNADGMLYSEVATGSVHWSIYYGYDADGNRLETNGGDFINGNAGDFGASFWTYNANNEMTGSVIPIQDQDDPGQTSSTYTYDNNGSLTEEDDDQSTQDEDDGDSFNSEVYTYDARGNMIKLVNQNGTTTYTYDDAGNRVKEVGPINGRNTTTTYLIDSNNPTGYAQTIEEHTNGAATPSVTYFVGADGTQGQANGGTVIYMLRDVRGYARVFTNSAGSITQYDDFDAYGNEMTNGTIPTTHYFADGSIDLFSGLEFHFGGRQSNPATGGFIERDPDGYGSNQNPITLNRYILDGDNAISNVDPSGHDYQLTSAVVTSAIISGLLGGALSSVVFGKANKSVVYGFITGAAGAASLAISLDSGQWPSVLKNGLLTAIVPTMTVAMLDYFIGGESEVEASEPDYAALAIEGFSWAAFDTVFTQGNLLGASGIDSSLQSSFAQVSAIFFGLAGDVSALVAHPQFTAGEKAVLQNGIKDGLKNLLAWLITVLPQAKTEAFFESLPGYSDMGPEAKKDIIARLLQVGAKKLGPAITDGVLNELSNTITDGIYSVVKRLPQISNS